MTNAGNSRIPQEPSLSIRCRRGEHAGTAYSVTPDRTISIGKDPNIASIVLPQDPGVSRLHCSITYSSSQNSYVVTDHSTNGTFLQYRGRLNKEQPTLVPDNALILLGNQKQVFELSKREMNTASPMQRTAAANNFSGNPNNFSCNQNNYSSNPNNFSGNQNNYSSNPNNFSGNQNNFGGNQNNFGSNQNNFGSNQNNFSGSPNNFGSNQNNFGGTPNNFGATSNANNFNNNNYNNVPPQYNPNIAPTPTAPSYHTVPKCTACGYEGDWKVEPLLRPMDIAIFLLFFLALGAGLIYLIAVIIMRSNPDHRAKICPHCKARNMWTFNY